MENNIEKIRVKRLNKDAILPKRATEGSAGYDLYACLTREIDLLPGETVKVGTGIALEMNDAGYGAFIFARSGLASNHGIAPANCVGVVDSDYRGEIMIPLHNHGKESFKICSGERIAQMVFLPVFLPELEETEEINRTERGEGGFGSTGKE